MVEILLVDNDATDTSLVLRQLKTHNLINHIHVIPNPEDICRFVSFDNEETEWISYSSTKMILTTVDHPTIHVRELVNQLRSNVSSGGIKIVLMTQSAEEADHAQSTGFFFDAFLTRPFDFEKFADVIADLRLHWVLLSEIPETNHPVATHARYSAN